MSLRLLPQSIPGQMTAVLGISFTFLLIILATFEYLEYENVVDTVEGDFTKRRLSRIIPVLNSINSNEVESYLAHISHCHDGYTLTKTAYQEARQSQQTTAMAARLSKKLSLKESQVEVGFASFRKEDFSYRDCDDSEMVFPLEGIVVSIRLSADRWLNAEVHPHEWHLTPSMSDWLLRSGSAFILIGVVALLFVRRLSQPFKVLADAAKRFAGGMEATEIDETGPQDVKKAISSFNRMQHQVLQEMERRTNTLAAISHDIRSPLTALRVKAELLEDPAIRADYLVSIEKMERITSSALAFLKGESRGELKRCTDLGELVDSVCAEFRDIGESVGFKCSDSIHYACRPNALERGIHNLIENAVKYAKDIEVKIERRAARIEISVSDHGPGIPDDQIADLLKPFARLSQARESDAGGFGLGLSITEAVAEGHDGFLTLTQNKPRGLVATINLPT